MAETMSFPSSRTMTSRRPEMIETFGESASGEAAARAGRSRDLGNHIHFCRWRQIERLIGLLSLEEAFDTVH